MRCGGVGDWGDDGGEVGLGGEEKLGGGIGVEVLKDKGRFGGGCIGVEFRKGWLLVTGKW